MLTVQQLIDDNVDNIPFTWSRVAAQSIGLSLTMVCRLPILSAT